MKAAGLKSISEAKIQEDKKGNFYVAVIEKKGRAAEEVIAEIVPEVVKNFPWPKSMRWGSGTLNWVRPLHSIVCTFGPETEEPEVVRFTIGGVAFILLTSQKLLPDRKPALSLSDDLRQYTVEMLVQAGGPLVNVSIRAAGLRSLPGLYLAEIERDGQLLAAVGPSERLMANDRLVFVGIIESVVDLRKTRGLIPATDQVSKLATPTSHRCLMEAVVSNRCPIIGQTIRDGHFRSRYNSAVIAVARDGKHIPGKIGDIVLQPGDTLLLEGDPEFAIQQRNSSDFFLVNQREETANDARVRVIDAQARIAAARAELAAATADRVALGLEP